MRHIFFLSFFIIFIFIGCTKSTPSNVYTSKEFPGVNKDALLNATKKVIHLSDRQFEIEAKRDSLKALKIVPIHQGFDIKINVNTIEMQVFEEDNSTNAKLKITHKENILDEEETILHGDIHTLFWERISYILGQNETWPSCTFHRLKLNFDGVLCDIINNQNTLPNENDIIVDAGFENNTIIYKKELKLADIDLDAMKEVVLPNMEDTTENTQIQIDEINLIDDNTTTNNKDTNESVIDMDMDISFDENEQRRE